MSLAAKQSRSTLERWIQQLFPRRQNNAGSNPGYNWSYQNQVLQKKYHEHWSFVTPKKEKIVNYNYLSNLANSRFTKNTSTNLERSHRLPHVCTKIKYGKLRVHRLKDTYVHSYDTIFQGGIAIWKGPISYLVFLQFPEANVRPLDV